MRLSLSKLDFVVIWLFIDLFLVPVTSMRLNSSKPDFVLIWLFIEISSSAREFDDELNLD